MSTLLVSSKGQIVLSAALRRRLGMGAGARLEVLEESDGRVRRAEAARHPVGRDGRFDRNGGHGAAPAGRQTNLPGQQVDSGSARKRFTAKASLAVGSLQDGEPLDQFSNSLSSSGCRSRSRKRFVTAGSGRALPLS